MKIRKGDSVKIVTGNDRGKTGTVRTVFPDEGRITVEGVNMKKKHVRPRSQGQKGELVRIPAPFQASRAMLVCPACGKAVRIGIRREQGTRVRICRKCGAVM